MLRIIMWGILYILSLGMLHIRVKYKDGLSIVYHTWNCKCKKSEDGHGE